jgi:hypothetical protein
LFVAWRALALVVAFLPRDSFPAEAVIKINVPVVLYSVGLAGAATIISGLWPALQTSRPNLAELLQNGARRIAGGTHARHTHGVLIGSQMALTVLVLTLASTAGKGFLRLLHAELGYDPQNCISIGIALHDNADVSWQDRAEYFEQLRARIASMPQVVSIGSTILVGIRTNIPGRASGAGLLATLQCTDAKINHGIPDFRSALFRSRIS